MTTTETISTAAGLYQIVDSQSSRFYIGSASNLRERWRSHVSRLTSGSHPNPILQAIWNKDNSRLSFIVTEFLLASPETLLCREQELLDKARVGKNKNCMNILALAGSHLGRKRSAETRAKLSAAKRGKKHSPESRLKMRVAKLERQLTEEHKRKISERSKGKPGPKHTAEQLAKWRRYSGGQVSELRALVVKGMPVTQAAQKTGISRSVANRIIKGEAYVGA